MELNKLCDKIISDANIKAAGITEEANQKSIELINNADKKHREKAENIKSKAAATAKDTYERMISNASLNARKEILVKKRELMNEVIEKAMIKLENLTSDEYKALLTKKAKEISVKASVEIAEKYNKDIDDKFLKEINPLLSKADKFAVSGFNFLMENSCINYNFKETAALLSKEKDAQISEILFS